MNWTEREEGKKMREEKTKRVNFKGEGHFCHFLRKGLNFTCDGSIWPWKNKYLLKTCSDLQLHQKLGPILQFFYIHVYSHSHTHIYL